ncbi:hypothetical protein V491_02915, partial [Pseudogymnoascus sp. VKM F-3775]
GEKHAESTENLGASGGNTPGAGGFITESGYGVPILASDEVAKTPLGHELQPAVSPLQDSSYDDQQSYFNRTGSGLSPSGSRPTSRHRSSQEIPNISQHGELDRHTPATPLEDVEEYEPLFPEDDKSKHPQVKPLTEADKLKALKGRHFPSQDVWEDAPESHMHTATVSTPQLPEGPDDTKAAGEALDIRKGETPEQAFARRQEELADMEFSKKETESFLKKQSWDQNASIAAETRPELKQRFPSRDIWEDSPDSLLLQTTVSGPQSEDVTTPLEQTAGDAATGSEEKQVPATNIAAALKPSIPPRPTRKLSDQKPDLKAEAPTTGGAKSPQTSPVLKAKPALPERSKPVIPSRPVKKASTDSGEGAPLATVTSGGSAKSISSNGSQSSAVAASKPKPPVPSRPVGSKIAALQGGFLSDLNNRLKLGPQAPKKEEQKPEEVVGEKEKAPLSDARKGRARGPARRAPAKAAAKVVEPTPTPGKKFAVSVASVWEIDPEDGDLIFTSGQEEVKKVGAEDKKIKAEEKEAEIEEKEAEIEEKEAEIEEKEAEIEDKAVPTEEKEVKAVELEEKVETAAAAAAAVTTEDKEAAAVEPEEEDKKAETSPITTAIGAPLLSAKEVVEETAASASKEVKKAIGTSESPVADVEVDETPVADAVGEKEVKDEVEDLGDEDASSSLPVKSLDSESVSIPEVEEKDEKAKEPVQSEKVVESKEA